MHVMMLIPIIVFSINYDNFSHFFFVIQLFTSMNWLIIFFAVLVGEECSRKVGLPPIVCCLYTFNNHLSISHWLSNSFFLFSMQPIDIYLYNVLYTLFSLFLFDNLLLIYLPLVNSKSVCV